MKKIVFVISFMATGSLHASLFPTQSEYYYQLGGSTDLYVPPVNRDQTITIGGYMNSGMGLNCNVFSPVVTITNTLKDLKESVSGIPATVIDNLKGSVAAFPLYKLQQSMPGLYNLLQNTSAGAQNEFLLRVQDCQQTKALLEQGESPLTSMLSVSDSQGWIDAAKQARQGTQVDIAKRAKIIAQKSDEYGLPWVHRSEGNSGGKSQKPIKVINDVVIAGYNLSLSSPRPLDNLSEVSSSEFEKTAFTRYWKNPDKAANWAVMVLGDMQLSHQASPSSHDSKAGVGLVSLLQSCPKAFSSNTCARNVSDYLWKLVDASLLSSEENLRKVSASNLMITQDIITTISHMSKEQQILTISRLSEEIAIQNLLDEAFMLRHLLFAGLQVQEVQNLKPARDMVEFALKRLDKEISSLSFEHDMRKKMMTETLNLLMSLKRQDLNASSPSQTHEQDVVKHGAIYRGDEQKG